MHHTVPGSDDVDDMVLLCRDCHNQKHGIYINRHQWKITRKRNDLGKFLRSVLNRHHNVTEREKKIWKFGFNLGWNARVAYERRFIMRTQEGDDDE